MIKLPFLKVPHIFFDSAIAGAIGSLPWLVYMVIRRFERQTRSRSPRVTRLLKKGYLVAYANQTKLARLTGMSRSSVTRAIKLLKAIGWISEIRIKNNGRAYKVGFINVDREGGTTEAVYWADRWLLYSVCTMPSDIGNGWEHAHALERQRRFRRALRRIQKDGGATEMRHRGTAQWRTAPWSRILAAPESRNPKQQTAPRE